MRTRALVLATTLTAATLACAAALPAAAADKGPGSAPGVVGYVTADSRYSGASVSGPVRKGPQGRFEVRLPGGTWLECGRSCADTLRRETVDFWRNHGRDGGSDGPGYLQFRF